VKASAALLMAAGAGSRMGATVPKCFLPLAGRPLFLYALTTLQRVTALPALVLVVPAGWEQKATQAIAEAGLPSPYALVPGGRTRTDSVRAGLVAVARLQPELVAIHDGARPLVTAELVEQTLEIAHEWGAALAAAPVTDTLKQAGADLRVTATPDREGLWRAQTPQIFRFELICRAHQEAAQQGLTATDDAFLVERLGHTVHLCPSTEENMKVTTPEDLARAERLLADRRQVRVGHGYDLHRLVPGRPLILGGITIPHSLGLLGHSDGDAVCHALADALLGAAALGDLGRHFPDRDPQYAGADSTVLLGQVAALVRQAGFRLVNCDVTILAQAPHLQPWMGAMRERLAQATGLPPARVSVKATTTEGLGPIGEGQALAAHAVALLEG
jgi:2-C-methyl-D-erythritol 4-phosphate cytidylyltransferase / 2-C-methyl-D-erythritol 2,4-cyclodiphosphate synthase